MFAARAAWSCAAGRSDWAWRRPPAVIAMGRAGAASAPAPFPPESSSSFANEFEVVMVFRALYEKFKTGLAKTRGVFSGIATLFRLRGRVDRDFLTELEKRLYL